MIDDHRCLRRVLAGTAAVALAIGTTSGVQMAAAEAAAADPTVALSFPTQAMEGRVNVLPGETLRAGYAFTVPGNHPAVTVTVTDATVDFVATCASGSGGGVIALPLPARSYADPVGDGSDWFPSADQSAATAYQSTVAVPDLCHGTAISLARGGTFKGSLTSTDTTDPINIRWHYSANGSAGGWSATIGRTTGAAAAPAPTAPTPSQIIVKVDMADGYTINSLLDRYPIKVDDGGLASRGIYLVSPTSTQFQSSSAKLADLASQLNGAHGILYAQVNTPVQLVDNHFYGWPYGSPTPVGSLPSAFSNQAAARSLQLAAAHTRNQGAGTLVAVLDTGVDATVPALAGRVSAGWNYVGDTSDTNDIADKGAGTASVGHGTFIAGLIALVAPQAKIISEKVLNSAGFGTIYGAAQAILDATRAGAKVINLSFGTPIQPTWNLLQDAIQQAHNAGVVVVAAAGNDASSIQHYPAAQAPTISVAALDPGQTTLTPFSDYGGWVDVAAPGQQVVGPLPGGTYAAWAGTSMATPFVAGQAALLETQRPGISPDKVAAAIEQTATKLPSSPIHFGAINIPGSLAFASNHP